MTTRGRFRQAMQASLLPLFAVGLPACGWSDQIFGCDDSATCEPKYASTGTATGTHGTGGRGGTAGASGTGGLGGTGGAGGASGGPTCMLEDPVDGQVIADDNALCAIWASSSLGDDSNPGTRELPVRTLMKAIALAGADNGPGRVYACADVFPETVELAEVSLYGGFRCHKHGWPYTVNPNERATIQAPPAPAPLILLSSVAESRIVDFNVVAGDAFTPGGSSIAVFAQEGSKAFFHRARIVAGNGADGLDGEDGSHDGQPAPTGLSGNDGTDACTMDAGLGGLAVTKLCPDGTQSVGGQGGDANAVVAGDGAEGFEAPVPNPLGFGVGGKGQDAADSTACTPGVGGAAGQDGLDGMPSRDFGKISSTGIIGAAGGDGTPGLPGQGGGGGGSSLGAACAAAGGPKNGGAAGGSGGSGGCGGKPGRGGQGGGSSLGFALLSNGISLDHVVVQAGNGGNGGHGGLRQPGGKGGLPGYGGAGFGGVSGAQQGCAGGVGGYGGDGGTGAGGRGGSSAVQGGPNGYTLHPGVITYIFGEKGQGGIGGKPPANDGEDGVSLPTIFLDLAL